MTQTDYTPPVSQPPAEVLRLLGLPSELTTIFADAMRNAFPDDLSDFDLLYISSDLRRAVHDATMMGLHRIQERGREVQS